MNNKLKTQTKTKTFKHSKYNNTVSIPLQNKTKAEVSSIIYIFPANNQIFQELTPQRSKEHISFTKEGEERHYEIPKAKTILLL